MKLQEHHSKTLLRRAGLPVPPWSVASTAAEARAEAEAYLRDGAERVVIKAQVLAGGRGKAGGVKLASTAAEAEQVASQILGMSIKGITVRRVMVTPGADIVRELYLAAVLDRTAKRIRLMGSAEGGMEIEELAETRPEQIHSLFAHPHLGLLDYQAREMAFALGLAAHLPAAAGIAKGVFRAMVDNDADLVEINPLAVVRTTNADGSITDSLQALDAKVTIDDSALHRHPDLEAMRDLDEEDPVDIEARAQGLSFIRLDGTIGCMVNGAGLAMTTMDLVKRAGGEPANFLDIGGGARADKVAAALQLILADHHVQAVLVNIFGGIARGDEVARGLVEARSRQARNVPMVVRIVGTNADLAAEILAQAGEGIQTATSLDEAVQKAVAIAAGSAAPA